MLVAVVGVALGVFWVAQGYNLGAELGVGDLSVTQASVQAEAGQITLVDIRRPDEWAATGVPENALLLDLRQDNFSGALLAHLQGDMRRPVALICARGGRSAQVAADLRQIGFSRVLDVPEGMLGSGAGVGWIEQGLPLRQP